MPRLRTQIEGNSISFDAEACAELGTELSHQYQTASPFPHIVIDDFLDQDILRSALSDFPSSEGVEGFDRDQERYKFQHSPYSLKQGLLQNLLFALNSAPFLRLLENMTGIEGLIPDPYYTGGGLHETVKGGHLGIHADFNIHKDLRLERRLNLLIYLNDDWDEEYGGNLELWDQSMAQCEVRVAPLMARAVLFNTSLDSFHGHPDPLSCPSDRSRRSIAAYYYTSPEDGVAALPKRTTVFKTRKNTLDKRDRATQLEHLIRDWVPPRLQNVARRLNRFG